MKKFLVLFIVIILAGCSDLPTNLNPVGISMLAQEKIAASVSKSELYAVGSSKIDTAGSLVAEGKARMQARENLKSKISNEVATVFNTYMASVDSNTKKVYTAALPDLRNYTTETLLLKAAEKIALVDGDKSYVALAIKREDIAKESKFVFTEYTASVVKKLENVKNIIGNSTAGIPLENTYEPLPTVSNQTKNNTKTNLPSIDEDPLFN